MVATAGRVGLVGRVGRSMEIEHLKSDIACTRRFPIVQCTTAIVCRIGLILILAVAGGVVPLWAQAPISAASAVSAAAAPSEADRTSAVRLLVGHSTVVETGSAIARVSLTSPDIADALLTSQEQLLVHGKAPGTISMFVWNRNGGIRRYEVIVQRDIDRLGAQIQQLFPNESIHVDTSGHSIVVAGSVSTKEVAEKALAVAGGYVEKKEEIVNLLQVQGPGASNQVLLHVRFAEVSRNAMTQLGTSFFTGPGGFQGEGNVGMSSTQQYPVPMYDAFIKGNAPPGDGPTKQAFSDFLNLFFFNNKYNIGTVVKLLQSKGLFQSLAEPNLVAESGKDASFLAGGEIPIPVVQGGGGVNSVTIEWKEFGIRLNFTPTVLGGELVHLKVRPEVSTLDFNNAIVLNGFRIPALSTRRAETEIQLRNGQTFAIAGLLSHQVASTLYKMPGIGDIPILGLLFQSKAAQKDQTELVVMITPEILQPNSPGVTRELPRTPEPFLAPLPQNKTIEPPPPAFPPVSRGGAEATQPATAPLQPAGAAAAVKALTPQGPTPMARPEPPAPGAAAPIATPSAPVMATPNAASQDRKTLERARREEQQQLEQMRKAQAAEAKRARKQAEIDAVRSAKEKQHQEQLAREQAKRDAEAKKKAESDAKKAAEAAKRQTALDAERQKALDQAAARLRTAQAEYQTAVARNNQ
jgi:pilus assembly protein CpaC